MPRNRINSGLAAAARYMHDELDSRCLLVAVAKVNEDGKGIRVCLDQNPDWYREFCASYMNRRRNRKWRRPRTFIKRIATLNALKRIAAGDLSGVYAERLLPFVQQQKSKMKTEVPF